MFSSIEFFVSEAWTGFRRSGIMSFVSVGTVIVSLVIFGSFLVAVLNLGSIVSSLGSRMEVIAYVDKDLSDRDAGVIQLKLSRLSGVEKVEYVTKGDAWESFAKSFIGGLNLKKVIGNNPLPNTFIITVRNSDMVPGVAEDASKIGSVDEVRYSGKLVEQISYFANAVRLGGLVLVSLLSFATLLIVVNTIRLTVLARETDIYIMRLVGATDSFIKWPFIIEGVMIGILGSVFSIIVLFFSYNSVIFKIQEALPFLPLVTTQLELGLIYTMVAVIGTFLGTLGGYMSISKSLKGKE